MAEDTELNQLVVAKYLEKLGHRAMVVSNGAEALEEWKKGTFDLVLMDILMPGMDGCEATRIMQSEENTGGRIPIIAMTANVKEEDIQGYLAEGMDAHLAKPLKKAELAQLLDRFSTSAAASGVTGP